MLFDADLYKEDLPEPVWLADPVPVNAAKLTLDWINGAQVSDLEKALPDLGAGMLRDMFRSFVWVVHGLVTVLSAATDTRTPVQLRHQAIRTNEEMSSIRRLIYSIRSLGRQAAHGLPASALWMTELGNSEQEFQLQRHEILNLIKSGYTSPEKIMLGSSEADSIRLEVFSRAKPSPMKKANWLRDACRNWKSEQRRRAGERHAARAKAPLSKELIELYYKKRGTEFETAFEALLSALQIGFSKLDIGDKHGPPDYLLTFHDSEPIVVELKTRADDKLVDYNSAVEVLSASEIHGHKDRFCVTLCHPGVDPSVPLSIVAAGRLSVVESHDLGEALVRLCEGTLTQRQLRSWLVTPGQALASDLPFRGYA